MGTLTRWLLAGLGLTIMAGGLWIGQAPAMAEEQGPILSTFEEQRRWVEGNAPAATMATETVKVTRKGDSFVVSRAGNPDQVLTREQFLSRLKLAAALNHALPGQYFSPKDFPKGFDQFKEFIQKPENVGKTVILVDDQGGDVIIWEVLGPDKYELTNPGSHEILSMDQILRKQSSGQLVGCQSNLKNMGTALEMYYADSKGYPDSLARLTPNYLKVIPACPTAGSNTYQYSCSSSPEAYTVFCSGHNHASHNVPPNFPQYNSYTGLVEKPK